MFILILVDRGLLKVPPTSSFFHKLINKFMLPASGSSLSTPPPLPSLLSTPNDYNNEFHKRMKEKPCQFLVFPFSLLASRKANDVFGLILALHNTPLSQNPPFLKERCSVEYTNFSKGCCADRIPKSRDGIPKPSQAGGGWKVDEGLSVWRGKSDEFLKKCR